MGLLLDALNISAAGGWSAAPERTSGGLIRPVDRPEASSTCVVNLPKLVTTKQVRGLAHDFKCELATDQPRIILDLSDVKEMDTAGLDLLLECLKEALRRDGTVSLRGISPEAATILELTGVDRVLSMFSAVADGGANSEPGLVGALLEDRNSKQQAVYTECG